jgi:CAI-1 autoinducer synthase
MTNNFNKNALNWQARPKQKRYPDFVNKVLIDYFDGRKNKLWNGEHILQGKSPSINSLIFSSNDYLHISQHPKLINAQINAMKEFGNGQMQSAVYLSNNSPLLEQSENQMAEFLDYPAALLSQSGWCANVGLIQALANRSVPVYLDFYAHMSFWAGVKAANAKPIPFQHNSIDSLHKRLQRYGPGIIAVDSIYSTIGSISPLYDYVDLAKTYQCLLIVDESHSLGTHGPQGKGLVASYGLSDQVDIITASLAKALSGRGGVIASTQQLIEYIRYSSLPAIFSSSLVPHDFAGFNASIEVIKSEEWRRTKLHANADYLRSALERHQFKLFGSNSQIIPIICGEEEHTMQIRKELEQEDIFGAVFCAPATPRNKSLIRLSVSANHEIDDLNHVISCLIHLSQKYPKLAFISEAC